MLAVVSRVMEARVTVDEQVSGAIGPGLLVYLGIANGDEESDARLLADRICKLRVFPDDEGKINRYPHEANASLLVISNFTLMGDCMRNRRPGFTAAAPADVAKPLYEFFLDTCRCYNLPVESGVFGAHMHVHSLGDGPVNLLLDTRKA